MGFGINADTDRAVRTGEANVFDFDESYVVMFWVRFNSVAETQYIWGIDDVDTGFGQLGDYVRYYNVTGTLNLRSTVASTPISANTWYHIAVVRTAGGQLVLYVNGNLDVSITAASGRTLPDRLEFGGYRVGAALELNGGLSRIKIWSGRDMSEAQVEAEMAYVDPQDAGGLWGYYPTYTPGPDLNDWSGNSRHLTQEGTLDDYGDPNVGWAPIAPAARTAAASRVNPSVTLGAIAVTPAARAANAARINPAIVLSSLAILPAARSAAANCVNPSVTLGAVAVTPAARAANATRINPIIVLGSLAILPAARSADASRVNPDTVLGAMAIAPVARTATATTVDPAVFYSAVQVTPEVATALAAVVEPQIEAGDILVSPGAVFVACATIDPAVVLSGIVVSPAAAWATAIITNPEIQFGSVIVNPAAVEALALAIDPNISLGDVVLTAIADALASTGRPWVLGDFSLLILTLPYRDSTLEFVWMPVLHLVARSLALSFEYDPS